MQVYKLFNIEIKKYIILNFDLNFWLLGLNRCLLHSGAQMQMSKKKSAPSQSSKNGTPTFSDFENQKIKIF